MNSLVTATNITKTFFSEGGSASSTPLQILKGISLELQRGEFVALVGPSGCGKSTLLSIIGLAERATSGEVLLDGVATQVAPEATLQTLRRTKLGYVFQNFNLLSTLTVRENIMVPLILQGISTEHATARAEELAERMRLTHRLNALPYALSGGEMQRVAIARAVSHNPIVILADEPTGSLDSHTGEEVLTLLREQTTHGIALLMATHSERAIEHCSRVIRMKDGALEA
jgi:putative ABC transport system ATP-binding protein